MSWPIRSLASTGLHVRLMLGRSTKCGATDGAATWLDTYQIRALGTTTRGKGHQARIAQTRAPDRPDTGVQAAR